MFFGYNSTQDECVPNFFICGWKMLSALLRVYNVQDGYQLGTARK